MESSGAAPVRGLDSLLAAATSSSVIQNAVEEVTSASIQVGNYLEIVIDIVIIQLFWRVTKYGQQLKTWKQGEKI